MDVKRLLNLKFLDRTAELELYNKIPINLVFAYFDK